MLDALIDMDIIIQDWQKGQYVYFFYFFTAHFHLTSHYEICIIFVWFFHIIIITLSFLFLPPPGRLSADIKFFRLLFCNINDTQYHNHQHHRVSYEIDIYINWTIFCPFFRLFLTDGSAFSVSFLHPHVHTFLSPFAVPFIYTIDIQL